MILHFRTICVSQNAQTMEDFGEVQTKSERQNFLCPYQPWGGGAEGALSLSDAALSISKKIFEISQRKSLKFLKENLSNLKHKSLKRFWSYYDHFVNQIE